LFFLRDKPSQAKKGKKIKKEVGRRNVVGRDTAQKNRRSAANDKSRLNTEGNTKTKRNMHMIIIESKRGEMEGGGSFFLFFVSTHRVVSEGKIASKTKCPRITSIVRSKKGKQTMRTTTFF